MIYVASPFWHDNESVRDKRREKAIEYGKKLFLANKPNYTPLIYSYLFKDNNAKEGYWINHGLKMIDACTEVHVLCLEGWESSNGIKGELKRAGELGLPIKYIHDHKRLCILGSRSISGKPVQKLIKSLIKEHQCSFVITAGEPEGVCRETIASCTRQPVTAIVYHLNPARMAGMFEARTIACLTTADHAVFIHDGESKGTRNEYLQSLSMGIPTSYYLHDNGKFNLIVPDFAPENNERGEEKAKDSWAMDIDVGSIFAS